MQRPIPALEIAGLRKSFDRPAVDGLDLSVKPGEFYMLLGPNGAGKTTTLRMVSGLLQPDAGSIAIFGIDAQREQVAAKRLVGWLSDEPMIYDKLSPLEYLEFISGLWGVERDDRGNTVRAICSDWLGPHAARATNAAKDSRAACARKWRWPVRWCTIRNSSSSTSR